MPSGLVTESEPLSPLVHGGEATWLQPLPDSLLGPGAPATAAIDRGSLRLVFVAALQLLSPRERAVLILRDVLDYPAAVAADILETSVASVNSSLQRARARIRAAGVHPAPPGSRTSTTGSTSTPPPPVPIGSRSCPGWNAARCGGCGGG
ncbi:sigma factor-like helix-turn-helix DNA-binding protein [Streptomyces bobili]|uniref:sigma factor-like helix-turn-helix DNA-binding protein n=1 Tax=Streptomyces bobili TaxID=67280 RepID=UPI00365C8413